MVEQWPFKPLVESSSLSALTKFSLTRIFVSMIFKKNRVHVGFAADMHPEQFLPPLHPTLPKVRIILDSLYRLYTVYSIGRYLGYIGICTVFQKGLEMPGNFCYS